MHKQPTAPRYARRLLFLVVLLGTVRASGLRGQCAGCANASFGPALQNFGYESGGTGYAIADFNQDGVPDVAAAANNNQGAISIHLGDGRGAFGSVAYVGAGQLKYPTAVTAGDLNGDGLPDLLVHDSQGLSVFLADGQGGFTLVYEDRYFGSVLAVVDLNGDGRLDAVTNDAVHFGNGDGTFGASLSLPGGPYQWLLATADFNGDGLPDLAMSNDAAFVLLGDGLGGFSIAGSYSDSDSGGLIRAGAARDLDGDGHVDLVVFSSHDFSPPSFLRILAGDGTGLLTLGASLPAPFPSLSAGVFLEDFDGDGVMDILLSASFAIYPGLGNGTFGAALPYNLPGTPIGIADFNSDGKPDVALAAFTRGISIGVNDGVGGFPSAPVYALGASASAAAAGSFHAGGHRDLVVASANTGALLVLAGDGSGAFGQPVSYPLDIPPTALAIADFNNDGHSDVAVDNLLGIAVFLGDGNGHLGTPSQFTAGTSGIASGDLNGDGNIDLVTPDQQAVDILLGDGAGGFAAAVSIALPNWPVGSVVLADINGDGKLDIVSAAGSIQVLLGNGDGTFADPIVYPSIDDSSQLVVGDWNGDGHMDLAVSVSSGEYIMILLGDGSGNFGPATSILAAPGTYSLLLSTGDFNGDGRMDLAASNPGSGEIDILMGDGAGGFGPASRWSAGSAYIAPIVGDWNEDGLADVAAIGSANTTILLNTNCQVRRLGTSSNVSTCNAAGQAFPAQPVLSVYDDGGNVVGCAGGTVVASLVPDSGTPGAALGGTKTVAVSAGTAAFSNLSVDLDGSGYRLQFAHAAAGTTRSRSFTVGVAPAAPAASNSGPFCQGQALSLYATTVPGAVYRWTGPNGFFATTQSPVIEDVSLEAAGTYAVTAIVNGCASTAAQTTASAQAPQPGPAVLGYGTVCSGSRLLLRVANAASAYHWYHDGVLIPAATGPVYTVDAAGFADAGSYTVSTSDETGCTTLLSAPVAVTVTFCYAESEALAVDPAGNGIMEPGETTVLDPTWRNRNVAPLTLSGVVTNFSGPPGATYTISSSAAGYGTIPEKAAADCLTATGQCYAVTASVSGSRPATHWDAYVDETLDDTDPARTWILHIGGSFSDVASTNPFYASIENTLHNGITAGCNPTAYCPDAGITRAQMAVLLLRARIGASFAPPPATGRVFTDVPADSFAAAWIEELFHEDITAGCGGGAYCPSTIVNREQMAVFILRAQHGPGLGLPDCTGIFADVPCPGPFTNWVEFLYQEGITGGCDTGPLRYCPDRPNTRGQMAVFLTKAFSLSLYGP